MNPETASYLKIYTKNLWFPVSRSGSQVCLPFLDCSSFQTTENRHHTTKIQMCQTNDFFFVKQGRQKHSWSRRAKAHLIFSFHRNRECEHGNQLSFGTALPSVIEVNSNVNEALWELSSLWEISFPRNEGRTCDTFPWLLPWGAYLQSEVFTVVFAFTCHHLFPAAPGFFVYVFNNTFLFWISCPKQMTLSVDISALSKTRELYLGC